MKDKSWDVDKPTPAEAARWLERLINELEANGENPDEWHFTCDDFGLYLNIEYQTRTISIDTVAYSRIEEE